MESDPGIDVAADEHGFLAPRPGSSPSSRCVRCGVATPAGVALCPEHNPGRVRGPSATQLHATILFGVIAGIVGFLVLAQFVKSPGGPYSVSLIGSGPDADGAVAVAFAIVNDGSTEGVATCRVTRDGVPRPDDLSFRSPTLPPGQRVLVERTVLPQPDGPLYQPERLSVICR